MTSAAGLALGGLRPVVCVYATFLNRAFDQVLMDAALHRLPVTVVLDRAGVTGDDGPSHNGMWDLAVLGVVPGIAIGAPRDARSLRVLLREALARAEGPTVLRFPKGGVGPDIPALERVGRMEVLARGPAPDVLLLSVGPLAETALAVAARAADQGIGVTVVDPRWVTPVDAALAALAARHRVVVTAEDGGRVTGGGSRVALALRDAGVDTPVHVVGLPASFLAQGSRAAILDEQGLSAQALTRTVVEALARVEPQPDGAGRTLA